MTLEAHEFIRRFLLHVLPDGFQRIRHVACPGQVGSPTRAGGFLANGHRKAKLALIRKLLDAAPPVAQHAAETPPGEPAAATTGATPPCPCCGGPMRVIEALADPRRRAQGQILRFDSS